MTRLLAALMLVVAPVIYLVIGFAQVGASRIHAGEGDLALYILLIVGATAPMMVPLIQRAQLATYRRQKSPGDPAALYITINIVSFALVEPLFIYGLVMTMLTGGLQAMPWFYGLGAVWTIVYWPRRGRFEEFLEQVKRT